MQYKLFISVHAKSNLESIIKYLRINWSERVVSDFLDKLVKITDYLKQNPYMFSQSLIKEEVRKCSVTKQIIFIIALMKMKKKSR